MTSSIDANFPLGVDIDAATVTQHPRQDNSDEPRTAWMFQRPSMRSRYCAAGWVACGASATEKSWRARAGRRMIAGHGRKEREPIEERGIDLRCTALAVQRRV